MYSALSVLKGLLEPALCNNAKYNSGEPTITKGHTKCIK
jgi:hypothetical protein